MSSRLPQPKVKASPSKPPTTPSRLRAPALNSPSRASSRSPTKQPPKVIDNHAEQSEEPKLTTRELIALKRAEVKKSQASRTGGGLSHPGSLEDALPASQKSGDDLVEEDILGRLSIRDTIENARSTGSVNLSGRTLPCLPSGLFEIHLGITPDKLKSVPDEPPLPPPPPEDFPGVGARKKRGGHDTPAWFEAQDLQVIKAWSNEIIEIQHEISLFGSLKVVDLHNNKLTSLPETFADLTALTTLDLSHNALSSLPANIFALPELLTLNLSHNSLTALAFNAPFAAKTSSANSQFRTTSLFMPVISRATSPLPRLLSLDVSHNKLSAANIDLTLPLCLTKFIASQNPLAQDPTSTIALQGLLRALGSLRRLKEARFSGAEMSDESFPTSLLSSLSEPFPSLNILDFGETKATVGAIEAAFKDSIRRPLAFGSIQGGSLQDGVHVLVGKIVLREPWEIEAEQKSSARRQALQSYSEDKEQVNLTRGKPEQPILKEAWEIEAEQGLLTEGGRRRARAAASAATPLKTSGQSEDLPKHLEGDAVGSANVEGLPGSASIDSGRNIGSSQYFTPATQSLVLPPAAPIVKKTKVIGHSTSFPSSTSLTFATKQADMQNTAISPRTVPLTLISQQPFAHTLRVLTLNKRRLDRSFDLPSHEKHSQLLPKLEELYLAGCDLADTVLVHRSGAIASETEEGDSEALLPLIARLFPSLRILDLSYNAITSASLTLEAVTNLIAADVDGPRRGLSHLRLQGNKLVALDGLAEVARNLFMGAQEEKTRCKLQELDIRDNAIEKLPAELGLLPLDVLLVDGNLFRIPQRRIWEKEGSKGLLAWLRGRLT